MKKYLLPEEGNFYKANLHCHTTVSDGTWTPERVKEEYKKRGYSIVAYTDHNLMMPHPELCDDGFLAMNGYEMDVNAPVGEHGWGFTPVCHACFVALSPKTDKQVCWNRKYLGYTWGNAYELAKTHAKFDENVPDFERVYSGEKISEMMKTARDNGFFVTYNHPTWSMESYPQYATYCGMHAMEIVNYSCAAAGYDEHNSRVYDDLLRQDKRIYCIATDDNHNVKADSFGGFTVIKAKNLEYETIGRALLDGHFYASEAPEIYELWVEDGSVYIRTSPASKIAYTTESIHAQAVYPEEGKPLTEATFKIDGRRRYFRITVTDGKGKNAYTNAYFIDEL